MGYMTQSDVESFKGTLIAIARHLNSPPSSSMDAVAVEHGFG